MGDVTRSKMRGHVPHAVTPARKDEIESVVAKAVEKPVKRKQSAE